MAKSQASFGKRLLVAILVLLAAIGAGVAIIAGIYDSLIHRTNGAVLTGGRKRAYYLYVPKSYQAGRPTPLVISIHGYAEWPAHQMEISRWNQLADEFGFLVVYPGGSGMPPHWFSSGSAAQTTEPLQDVQFISDLIDQLAQTYPIDPARIYANGLSNGGGMSFMLACKLSQRIAAIGSVAGAYLLPWDECQPERVVPVIAFHGTQDPIVPFHGGPSRSFNIPFPDIPTWMQTLAERSGCAATAEPLPRVGEVSGVRYRGSAKNAEVIFYTVAGGGHSWPGGGEIPRWIVGHITQDVNATRLMWDFFQRHTLED